MGPLLCPSRSVACDPLRRGSGEAWSFLEALDPRGASAATCEAALRLRDGPNPGDQWQGSCLHRRIGMGHRPRRPARSFHHSHPGLLKQEKAGHKPFSPVVENNPSCSHLAEWGVLRPPWWWSHSWPLLASQLLSLPSRLPHGLSPPPLPLPTPEHEAAFPSPSPGRKNGLIQGHPARSVSLRQRCAQLCVKNGSQPPSEQAGLVGANYRGIC